MCDSPHLTRHLRLVAAGVLLIAVVAAVEVAVADLVAGDPEAALALLARHGAALVVAVVLVAVVAVGLVALVVAVVGLVAAVVRRHAVGRVKLVVAARKLAGLAVGRS